MELQNATWSLGAGRMVEFRLVEGTADRIHPFKHHTKRRGNRAGTRFQCEIHESESDFAQPNLIYLGEVMLANWSDGSMKGQSLKLWLDDDANVHPFAGYDRASRDTTGSMFVAAFWELDDDDSVIDQQRRGRVEKHRKPQTLSQAAFMIGRNERFHQYLAEKVNNTILWDEEKAATFIKLTSHPGNWNEALTKRKEGKKCMLESRSELDHNEASAKLFHDKIRKPFAVWGDDIG